MPTIAVKKLKEMWEIENAFISFGGSSIYAFGKNVEGKPWQINLSDKMQIDVDDFAVGASGTSVLGNHIIDARTGKVPESQPFRTWCFCGNTAIADAMATAFMLLNEDEIREICQAENLNAAIQNTPDSDILFI
jgi:thiamine biosynthesis lipoprotein ApbE